MLGACVLGDVVVGARVVRACIEAVGAAVFVTEGDTFLGAGICMKHNRGSQVLLGQAFEVAGVAVVGVEGAAC